MTFPCSTPIFFQHLVTSCSTSLSVPSPDSGLQSTAFTSRITFQHRTASQKQPEPKLYESEATKTATRLRQPLILNDPLASQGSNPTERLLTSLRIATQQYSNSVHGALQLEAQTKLDRTTADTKTQISELSTRLQQTSQEAGRLETQNVELSARLRRSIDDAPQLTFQA